MFVFYVVLIQSTAVATFAVLFCLYSIIIASTFAFGVIPNANLLRFHIRV